MIPAGTEAYTFTVNTESFSMKKWRVVSQHSKTKVCVKPTKGLRGKPKSSKNLSSCRGMMLELRCTLKGVDANKNSSKSLSVWLELSQRGGLLSINPSMKYVITTTSMKKIIVEAKNEDEAVSIATTQMQEGEAVMMICSDTELDDTEYLSDVELDDIQIWRSSNPENLD